MITEKRRLWKLLLLTIPTLGIYNIYFWFRFTQDLNDMNREEKKIKNYILVLFLSIITLGIYRWVWLFYLEDRLQITGEQMGIKVHPGPGTTLFLWTFGRFILIGPLIADFCIIHNMNKLAVEYNAGIAKNTKVLNKNDSLTSNKEKKAASGKSGKASDKKPSKTEKAPEKMSAGAAAINARAAAKMAAEAAAAKAAAETATSASIAKTAVPASSRTGSPSSTMNRTTKTTAEKQKVVNKQVFTPDANPKVVNKQVYTPDANLKAAQKKAADTSSTAKTDAANKADSFAAKKTGTSSTTTSGSVSLDVEKNRPRADSSTLTVNPGLNNMPTNNKK